MFVAPTATAFQVHAISDIVEESVPGVVVRSVMRSADHYVVKVRVGTRSQLYRIPASVVA